MLYLLFHRFRGVAIHCIGEAFKVIYSRWRNNKVTHSHTPICTEYMNIENTEHKFKKNKHTQDYETGVIDLYEYCDYKTTKPNLKIYLYYS